MLTKPSDIRKAFLEKRLTFSASEQRIASEKISQLLLADPKIQKAKHIAGYFAIRGELDLRLVLQSLWQQGKSYYLPTIDKFTQTLYFLPYTSDTPMKTNSYGVPEPDLPLEERISVKNLDIVLLPLVAADKRCNRIGMGAGYYDKTFAFRQASAPPPYLYGIAYTWQILDTLEPQSWDVPLDFIFQV